MNNSTDAIISIALERQAEKVHRVQAADQVGKCAGG